MTPCGYGWTAVATFQDPKGRLRCLAGLAGALVDYGDRAAAEDAWTVVAEASDEVVYRFEIPGRVIGPAFAATYLLAKTEDTTSETPVEATVSSPTISGSTSHDRRVSACTGMSTSNNRVRPPVPSKRSAARPL